MFPTELNTLLPRCRSHGGVGKSVSFDFSTERSCFPRCDRASNNQSHCRIWGIDFIRTGPLRMGSANTTENTQFTNIAPENRRARLLFGYGNESDRCLSSIASSIVEINFNLVGCLVDKFLSCNRGQRCCLTPYVCNPVEVDPPHRPA